MVAQDFTFFSVDKGLVASDTRRFNHLFAKICSFQGIGTLCVAMYDILLPVIKFSTDVSQDPHVYLMEDGLDLWLSTLHCSPAMTPGLLDLFSNMPGLYGECFPILLREFCLLSCRCRVVFLLLSGR